MDSKLASELSRLERSNNCEGITDDISSLLSEGSEDGDDKGQGDKTENCGGANGFDGGDGTDDNISSILQKAEESKGLVYN